MRNSNSNSKASHGSLAPLVKAYVESPTTPQTFTQVEAGRALELTQGSAAYQLDKLVASKQLVRVLTDSGLVGYTKVASLPAGQALPPVPKRSRPRRRNTQPSVDALITLSVGGKESLTCSLEEARQLYTSLKRVFGE